jgi:anti-anti-sigma regulatory factor
MLDVRRNGTVFEVTGSLDDDGGRRLLALVATCEGDVRIDGSRLDRIDGAGLTALVLASRQCRADGREFELVTVAPTAVSGLRAGRQLPSLFAPHVAPTAPPPRMGEPTGAGSPKGHAAHPRRWPRLHRHPRNEDIDG